MIAAAENQNAGQAASEYVPVAFYPINLRLVSQLPLSFLCEHKVLPLERHGDLLLLAMADPNDRHTIAAVRRLLSCEVEPALTSAAEINIAIARISDHNEAREIELAAIDVLVCLGVITESQADDLRHEIPITEKIAAEGRIDNILSEDEFVEALSVALYTPRLRLGSLVINPSFARVLPREIAERWEIVAIFPLPGREMLVASCNPPRLSILQQIERTTGFRPVPVLSTRREVQQAIRHVYDTPVRKRAARKPAWQEIVDSGLVTRWQLRAAETLAAQTGEPIEKIFARLGFVNDADLLWAEARAHNLDLVRLREVSIDAAVAQAVPEPTARRYRCLPCHIRGGSVFAVTTVADSDEPLGLLEAVFGQAVRLALCSELELEEALNSVYRHAPRASSSPTVQLEDLLKRTGRLSARELGEATRRQQETGRSFGQCLLELGLLDEVDLTEMVALQHRLPWLYALRPLPLEETRSLLALESAQELIVLPLYYTDALLTVGVADPADKSKLQTVSQHVGFGIRPVLFGEGTLRDLIEKTFQFDLSKLSPTLRSFGASLVHAGLLSRDQLMAAWHRHLRGGVPFDIAITGLRLLSEEQLASAMAEYLGVPRVNLRPRRVAVKIIDALGYEREVLRWAEVLDIDVARKLPEAVARSLEAVAVSRSGDAVVVAFVNPVRSDVLEELARHLGRRVQPAICTRTELIEAIGRIYGRQLLGELLLRRDLINERQLAEALEQHRRAGVHLGEALVSLGYLTRDELASLLSLQKDMPYFSLAGIQIDHDAARSVPESFAREHRLIPLGLRDGVVLVATARPDDIAAFDEVSRLTGAKVEPVVTSEDDIEDALERIYRDDYIWQSANELVFRYPEDSAIRVLTKRQKMFFLAFLALSAGLIALNPMAYFTALISLCSLFYVSFSAYKFYLIYKAIAHELEIDVTDDEVAAVDDRDLPKYTVLVPLYREAEVLPTLIQAIDDLDYPKAKLDVKLLLEEDDDETLEAIRRHELPAHFKVVVVPNRPPRGKPKACNYGLIHAEGEYVVIYDAEDIPEPDQLKKAVLAFRKADPRVQCIQAKLNYYNRDQNLLTRWFTIEYSMWFDLFIPGLDASNAPIPLGGTSNHFRTARLKELGAWDPYNVTEDADLGVRLFKAGWKTAVIDSTTYEEANSELYNWIRQRSRWVKGYIQTYLVHMRHPLKLLREIGVYQFFSFNMVVGGTFFGFLINPIYWTLTALWFTTHWDVIQRLFPAPVFYVGALGLYIGNFAFMYTNVIGCLRREYYELTKYALLTPLYWAMMSIGAWKGFIQLFYRPSYWEKTVHGLYRNYSLRGESLGNL